VVGFCCADEFDGCADPVFRGGDVCAATPERLHFPFNDFFSFDFVPISHTLLYGIHIIKHFPRKSNWILLNNTGFRNSYTTPTRRFSTLWLKWEHPDGPGVETRTVSVPLHDRVRTGTLRRIAEDAGAKDFEKFCEWIDRNR
jgi:hypothetical protein